MKHIAFSVLSACTLMLSGCSTDNDIVETNDDGCMLHTAQLVFSGTIDYFDRQTRAVTSDWEDGATLYIRYTTASGIVNGTATYDQTTDQWNVQYYGSITSGQTTQCEVYFFENPQSTTMTSVTFSEQSAVFADKQQATYLFKDGVVKLTAHLKPLTGRLCFRGTTGQRVTFSGLKWYNGYNITDNTFTTQDSNITLTVASDGFTPYVYTTFADASTPRLTVESGDEDYAFSRTFDSSVLAIGESGYLDIPTMTSRNGWELIDRTWQEFTVKGNGKTVTFRMKKVKAGTFQMGKDAGGNDVTPVHTVTLTKDYYIGETEVTQALWYAVMGLTPTSDGDKWNSTYKQGDEYPAYRMSYEDCDVFLKQLNKLTGKKFRFPTEAEWEYAAKGGCDSKGYIYAGSNTIDDVAWYSVNSYDVGTSNVNYGTHEVKIKQPNELGLYDMSGNVWEWCSDWYDSYSSSVQTNPKGADAGTATNRVFRGGCWSRPAPYCSCVMRGNNLPSYRQSGVGLRLAM